MDTNNNSVGSSQLSTNDTNKKTFTNLKIINSEIFEKLHIKTEKLVQQELKKCFNRMKISKNKKLSIYNMYNIEYTDLFNKVEEAIFDNLSIVSISFSLSSKKKNNRSEYESERYLTKLNIYRNSNLNITPKNNFDNYYDNQHNQYPCLENHHFYQHPQVGYNPYNYQNQNQSRESQLYNQRSYNNYIYSNGNVRPTCTIF